MKKFLITGLSLVAVLLVSIPTSAVSLNAMNTSSGSISTIHLFHGTIWIDGVRYDYNGWFDDDGHWGVNWEGNGGSGSVSWFVAPNDGQMQPVQSWDEAVAYYGASFDGGNSEIALAIFNEIATTEL